jgi:ribonucleoside-triphosphate reductase
MKSSKNIVESYLNKYDWRVNESSSAPFSFGAMNKYMSAEVSKDYWLREVYPEHIAQAYVDGYIHIHDLGGLTLYCTGYSLKDILMKGVRGVPTFHIFSRKTLRLYPKSVCKPCDGIPE